MSESLVGFYRRHGISPVRQDISDLDRHFERRSGLYRHLGLLPLTVRDRTVLEIGPGSGYNSLFTATLRPSRYVLLDGNPRGVQDIERLFADYPELRSRIEVELSLLQDYRSTERFDFVFCEGMLALAGVPDPSELLREVSRFVAPDGMLVITTIDCISDFPETLRRFVGQLLIDPSDSIADQAARLLPVMSPHLATLASMSRRHDDWIVDNLLNPASIGPLLAIPDAIQALDGDFDILGASPRFFTDWRWYKTLVGEGHEFNRHALANYWAEAHNLLDHRTTFPRRAAGENQRLYRACHDVREAIAAYERHRSPARRDLVRDPIERARGEIEAVSPPLARAIDDVLDVIASPESHAPRFAASPAFGPWFGRGQQYLSFTRRH